MPTTIHRPKNFDQVVDLIDKSDWSAGDMMYLILTSLDAMLSTMDKEAAGITIHMIVNRYLKQDES